MMIKNFPIVLLLLSISAFSQQGSKSKELSSQEEKPHFIVDTLEISGEAQLLLDNDDVEFANNVPSYTFLKDSIVYILLDDPEAASMDSIWQRELFKSSLYNDYREKLLEQDYTKAVRKELPTDTLKKRLALLDAKTPFNIEYNPLLENVINSYLKRNKKAMEHLMELSAYYFPLFEQKMDAYNVPLEMKYLALVESSLNPRARSWVGATGLWQFMYATGKMHGLEVSSYVDERMDPVLATDAAAQYLSNLYRVFEDWDLALASYNSGPGNVSKAIRRSGGSTNYWNLRSYLPRETANYVPAFIAFMYIFEYAEEHGFQPPTPMTTYFETDTIQTRRQLTFDEISEVTGVEKDFLKFLNPSYKLDIIPFIPNKDYTLRLPRKKSGLFVNNENEIYHYVQNQREQKTNNPTQLVNAENKVEYQVKRGDYLGKIAENHGVGVSDIKRWNNLGSNRLRIGQRLIIYAGETVDTAENSNPPKIYTVRKGDSLWSISRKFPEVTIQQIKTWNNMDHGRITPGMKLKLSEG